MTLDQLIEELQRLRREHGDMPVRVETRTEVDNLAEIELYDGELYLKSRGA